MEGIKAVIFDLDNTILDRTGTFQAFTESFVGRFLGHLDAPGEIFARIVELDEDGYKDKRTLFQQLLEEMPWEVKPSHEELMLYYKTEYVKQAKLMDQAAEVLQYIRSKYKTALITNGRNDIQYGKIDRLGIRELFDFIIVSEEAGCKKPDPRIFEAALAGLGLMPSECIYVGDHPVNDMEGAANAGLGTIWYKVNQPWRGVLNAAPLYTIDSFTQLVHLV
ncbi:HAD family hydrolase [Paenibacillus sp. N4]|uniref:HAD family hydrolase n=1 Tax=Paenibacillus vietnamensis TaxID=2590547 RepID=UPI001CD19419|nr:HAD family hydrolase [Paenibacillus vietnamensis]MCA0754181.1 HAD family hydrolase [Paenibacillus vietnamensis]